MSVRRLGLVWCCVSGKDGNGLVRSRDDAWESCASLASPARVCFASVSFRGCDARDLAAVQARVRTGAIVARLIARSMASLRSSLAGKMASWPRSTSTRRVRSQAASSTDSRAGKPPLTRAAAQELNLSHQRSTEPPPASLPRGSLDAAASPSASAAPVATKRPPSPVETIAPPAKAIAQVAEPVEAPATLSEALLALPAFTGAAVTPLAWLDDALNGVAEHHLAVAAIEGGTWELAGALDALGRSPAVKDVTERTDGTVGMTFVLSTFAHYVANTAGLQALRRSIDEQTALLGLSARIVLHARSDVARSPSRPIVDWSALLKLRTDWQLAPDAMRALLLPLQTDAEVADLVSNGTRAVRDDECAGHFSRHIPCVSFAGRGRRRGSTANRIRAVASTAQRSAAAARAQPRALALAREVRRRRRARAAHRVPNAAPTRLDRDLVSGRGESAFCLAVGTPRAAQPVATVRSGGHGGGDDAGGRDTAAARQSAGASGEQDDRRCSRSKRRRGGTRKVRSGVMPSSLGRRLLRYRRSRLLKGYRLSRCTAHSGSVAIVAIVPPSNHTCAAVTTVSLTLSQPRAKSACAVRSVQSVSCAAVVDSTQCLLCLSASFSDKQVTSTSSSVREPRQSA